MSEKYQTWIDPELWSFVDQIARHVPRHLDVWRSTHELQLIDTLGAHHAFDALRALLCACQRYDVELICTTLKIALGPRTHRTAYHPPRAIIDWAAISARPWSRACKGSKR